MNIKATLERKLGALTTAEVEFAVQQFERNSKQIGQVDRKMSTAQALDEMSTNIDFYRRRLL